jgi:hypothetical protein
MPLHDGGETHYLFNFCAVACRRREALDDLAFALLGNAKRIQHPRRDVPLDCLSDHVAQGAWRQRNARVPVAMTGNERTSHNGIVANPDGAALSLRRDGSHFR